MKTSFQDDFDREVERQAHENEGITQYAFNRPSTTQIAPATDEEIAELEEAMEGRAWGELEFIPSLIARIKAEREQAIFECAEIARTWAQDNETIQPSYNGITNAILALLTNNGEQRS